MEKRIVELKAQKREALRECNRLQRTESNENEEKVKNEDEEKKEVLDDEDDDSVRWATERKAMMAEMDALDAKTKENVQEASQGTFQITPVHLLIALLIMLFAYTAGAWNGNANDHCIDVSADEAQKIEM